MNIFDDPGAAESFLASTHEHTLRAGWDTFTYALMPNHFHLMLRTPRANLSRGMHLLLSSFALRFNGFRDEQGHVFQGRYHAKRMPATVDAGRLFDYINLNHVRKNLLKINELKLSELSGMWGLCNPSRRGEFKQGEALVRFTGHVDSPAGWAAYHDRLKHVFLDDPQAELFKSDWQKGERYARAIPQGMPLPLGLKKEEIAKLDERHSEEVFERLLKIAGRERRELELQHGMQSWKMEIAAEMLRQTTVSSAWLTRRLVAGSVSHFSRVLRERVRPR